MNNEKFMKEALREARKAFEKGEIPVGAVIVKDDKIIARAHNLKETHNSAISHAEILAIKKANKKLQNWRLIDCEMYVTLEPCKMCLNAIISSRIKKIYIGTTDPKADACGSLLKSEEHQENNEIEEEKGILKEECEYILKDFFKMLRKRRGKKCLMENIQKK